MNRTLAIVTLTVAGFLAPTLVAAEESSPPPANASVERKLNALQQQMVELQAAMNKLNGMMGSGNMMQPMGGKGGMDHMMGGMDPEAMKQHCQNMMGGKAKPKE